MTRKKSFADSFWGNEADEFCSSAGFETLVKRIKDGHKITKDFEEFLKQRAKIEESYAKSMQNLAGSKAGNLEIGTMRAVWDSLKQQMEAVALEHSQMASQFHERAKSVSLFAEKQRTLRKQEEEVVSRQIKKKVEAYNKNMQCKKAYEKACREAITATEQVSAAKMAGSSHEKSLQQSPAAQFKALQTKEQKSAAEKEKTDQNYQEVNSNLDVIRSKWEENMLNLCKEYEKLEIERFQYVKNEIWVYTNLVSQTCVDVDECCEKIRMVVEHTNLDEDLLLFIDQKGTGSVRPASIPYKKYGDPDTPKLSSKGRGTLPPMPNQRPPALPPGHPAHR